MDSSGSRILLAAAVVCLLVAAPCANAAVDCKGVESLLSPCIPYVQGALPDPPPVACCQGIQALLSQAGTPADRQQICQCLSAAIPSVPGIIFSKVIGLPGKCGFQIPFSIPIPVDCSRYVIPHSFH